MTVNVLSRCMCVNGKGGEGGFDDILTTECVVETFTLHSYKSQVQKAYSEHDNDTPFAWLYFNQ